MVTPGSRPGRKGAIARFTGGSSNRFRAPVWAAVWTLLVLVVATVPRFDSTVGFRAFPGRSNAELPLGWDGTGVPGRQTTPPLVPLPNDRRRLDPVAAGRPVVLEGRLLAATAAEDQPPSRPVWVGAVVGLSGVAGLIFSRALRDRRRFPPD